MKTTAVHDSFPMFLRTDGPNALNVQRQRPANERGLMNGER
jgi:hypothetical protein